MAQERIVRGFGIYEQLKEHKPAALLVVDGDGDTTKINVPDVRNRHARVMVTLREIAWVRVDMLDKKGGLVYRHQRNADDRDAPAGEIEDMPTSRSIAEQAALLNIMLRGQEMVLARHAQATQGKDETLMRLCDSALRMYEGVSQRLEHAMAINHQLATDLVGAQLAQAQQLSAPQVDEDGNPRPESDRAMSALMPTLLRSMLERPEAKKPESKSDGKKNGATQKEPRPEPSPPAPQP